MNARRLAIGLLSLLSLSSCLHMPKRAANGAEAIETIPLLSPATLHSDVNVQQVLRAAFGKQEVTVSSVLSVRGDTLNVVGLTPLGQRVFAVRLQATNITVETGAALPGPSPRQLLADIQLSLWPLVELQRALAGTEWRVSDVAKHTRRLHRDGRLIAEVHYAQPDAAPWNGRIWLVNFQFGYSLSVEPAAQP